MFRALCRLCPAVAVVVALVACGGGGDGTTPPTTPPPGPVAPTVALSTTAATLTGIGATSTLTATATPASSVITWTSSNPALVSVVGQGTSATLTAVASGLFVAITIDYLEVEANTQVLAWEAARIGTGRIVSEAPEVLVLTQWREYLRLARVESPGTGMTDAEILWMERVSERFPYSTPMRQIAAAQALNGRPEAAQATLVRLCLRHSAQRWRR